MTNLKNRIDNLTICIKEFEEKIEKIEQTNKDLDFHNEISRKNIETNNIEELSFILENNNLNDSKKAARQAHASTVKYMNDLKTLKKSLDNIYESLNILENENVKKTAENKADLNKPKRLREKTNYTKNCCIRFIICLLFRCNIPLRWLFKIKS